MTTPATLLLSAAAVAAVADWFAVATGRRRLEYAAKPAVMLALIGVALTLRPVSPVERNFFVAALSLGLLSDVFLMLPQDLFLLGLGAALVEHLAYISGFRARELSPAWFAVAAVVALLSVAVFYPPIHRSLHAEHPRFVGPVIAYLVVFVVMVASAGGTGSIVAVAGALLFFYSDAILARNRFVAPLRYGRIMNIVPYHVGQALLVFSLPT